MSLEYAMLILALLTGVAFATMCSQINRINKRMQATKTVILAEIADVKHMIKLLYNHLDVLTKSENTC